MRRRGGLGAEQRESHRGLSRPQTRTKTPLMTTGPSMLAISQLNAAYDGSQILRNVSLTVPERQVVSLMGRNGVGKTTTLKCIVGLLKPVSGSISLASAPIEGLRADERARQGIEYVPQGRDVFPNLTVWET